MRPFTYFKDVEGFERSMWVFKNKNFGARKKFMIMIDFSLALVSFKFINILEYYFNSIFCWIYHCLLHTMLL